MCSGVSLGLTLCSYYFVHFVDDPIACLYVQSVTFDDRQRSDRRCRIFRERGSVRYTSMYSFRVRFLLTTVEEDCGNSSLRLADRRHM